MKRVIESAGQYISFPGVVVVNPMQSISEPSALKVKAAFRAELHIPEGGDRFFRTPYERSAEAINKNAEKARPAEDSGAVPPNE
jgi:hypothetical protein